MSEEQPNCNNEPTLILRNVSSLQNASFIHYLRSRGIPMLLAKRYLKEFHVYNNNTGNDFHAFGIRNVNEGYELKNPCFEGCIEPRGISFIRGTEVLHDEAHVFNTMLDFLSVLAWQKTSRVEWDAIILNGLNYLPQAFPYLRNYTYETIYTWLDNDKQGEATTQALHDLAKQEGNFVIHPMNSIYAPHRDVSTWHKRFNL